MSVETVPVWQLTCNRCGHVWISRLINELPLTCAKCRHPGWNKVEMVGAVKE